MDETDLNWKDQYKKWRQLTPIQTNLLDNGAHSLSQSWLLNEMWSDWHQIKNEKSLKLSINSDLGDESDKDPWFD